MQRKRQIDRHRDRDREQLSETTEMTPKNFV